MATTAGLGTVGGSMSVPSPLALWRDPPGANPAARLLPYKTTAGYWVFTSSASKPVGSTQGALVDGTYDTLVTTTTTGLRVMRGPSGGTLLFR